jgi:hypothetical protein
MRNVLQKKLCDVVDALAVERLRPDFAAER